MSNGNIKVKIRYPNRPTCVLISWLRDVLEVKVVKQNPFVISFGRL